MEETLNGYVRTGGWHDVVEHGERITTALLELDADLDEYEESVIQWDEWRPKVDERLRSDVSEKTAEHTCVDEGPGEQAGVEPNEDIKTAGKSLTKSVERTAKGDAHEAFERWQESVGHTARAADSSWRKLLRVIEKLLYKHVMTKVSPYYFDTKLLSANLQRVRSRDEGKQYRFEVNINDDAVRQALRSRIEEYEDSVERWHVATPTNTETAEHAEGAEPPQQADEDVTLNPNANLSQQGVAKGQD